MKFKIITELLFIIPFTITLYEKLYFYSLVISISILTAILYHLNYEKKYLTINIIASSLLILTNFYYIYLSNFKYPFFPMATLSLIISFYFWISAQKKNYDFNHSMWHIASVMITLFCLLSYNSIF